METKTLRCRDVIGRISGMDESRARRLMRMHERFEELMALSDEQLRIRNSNERIDWPPARREDLDALRSRSLDERGYGETIGKIGSRKENQ